MVIKNTTYTQDKDLMVECIRVDAAEVVQYVGKNYNPEDVFENAPLIEWARDNSGEAFDPEDVFGDDALAEWAKRKGYVLAAEE